MCNSAAFIWAPHVCVASVVGGLFAVGLAGFLLEGKGGVNIVWHHPPLRMDILTKPGLRIGRHCYHLQSRDLYTLLVYILILV